MRDVLFRGKATMSTDELDELEIIHEDGWVFGNYIENGFSPYIVGDLAEVGNDYIAHEWWVEVIPESVGQWTGLKDKNDREIYEGDICKANLSAWNGKVDEKILIIYWHGVYGKWAYAVNKKAYEMGSGVGSPHGLPSKSMEITGNIYENPELLKGATNGSS